MRQEWKCTAKEPDYNKFFCKVVSTPALTYFNPFIDGGLLAVLTT